MRKKLISILERIEYHLSQPWLNLFKTIYFNFRMLPFNQAIRLPIFFYGKVRFFWLQGSIVFQDTSIKTGMVKFGRNTEYLTGFSKSAFILLNSGSKLFFHGPCSFANDFNLRIAKDAELHLGKYTFFGGRVKIISTVKISIGDYSRVANETQIIDSNFHFILNTSNNTVSKRDGEIKLGPFNWVGNKCSIYKGTKTKSFTTASSMSLLNSDYSKAKEKYLVLAGIPAKIISNGNKRIFDLDLENEIIDFFHSNPLEKEMKLKDSLIRKTISLEQKFIN